MNDMENIREIGTGDSLVNDVASETKNTYEI